MMRRRKSAVVHNIICNALAVVLLVVWHLLGIKSALGVIIDGPPSIVGMCYILASRRVRNTFVVT